MDIQAFGCSTLSVQNPEGGYASVSTVNLDFIRQYDTGQSHYFTKYRENGSYHYDSHPSAAESGGYSGRSAGAAFAV